jgi:hypothetical protein
VSGVEGQLRDLMEAAVGEPPRRVTVAAVRRRVIRRRIVECVSGAVVIAVLAGVGVALAATLSGGRVSSADGPGPAGLPRYYVQVPAGPNRSALIVRSTATGAVTARMNSPVPGGHLIGARVAAAEAQTYFVAWAKVGPGSSGTITDSRIYRFKLTRTGRIGENAPVTGGALGAEQVGGITASADGSLIAVTESAGHPATPDVVVINTRTGRHSVWQDDPAPDGMALLDIGDLVLARDGTELGFDTTVHCPKGVGNNCHNGNQVRTITPATAGGELASSQVAFRQSELTGADTGYINDALLSPDGSAVDLTAIHSPNPASQATHILVLQVAVGQGQQPVVLYDMNTGNGMFYRSFSTDPTGAFPLVDFGPSGATRNGWIDDGKLVPLTPANGSGFFYETW